jgi:hypothetical protein
MSKNLLVGKEFVWVDNPIDAFFLQVQGSGRVVLEPGGEIIRRREDIVSEYYEDNPNSKSNQK